MLLFRYMLKTYMPKTVTHLVWCGPRVEVFWQKICDFIHNKIKACFNLFWKDVLLGYISKNMQTDSGVFLINILLILAHYHTQKFSGRKPCFSVFFSRFILYINSN